MTLLVLFNQPTGSAVDYSLTCATGSYAYAGKSAVLNVARALSLSTGSYAYVGKAASLDYVAGRANYALNLDAGAYVYAGKVAALNYVPGGTVANKSGVNRLWLIEYYTKAFTKAAPLKTVGVSKALQRKRQVQRDEAIEAQVIKAERDLEVLTQGISDARAAQAFTQRLVEQAQAVRAPEFDFMAVANEYKKRARQDDDELLLLSMVI